jgi:hypothetical protein
MDLGSATDRLSAKLRVAGSPSPISFTSADKLLVQPRLFLDGMCGATLSLWLVVLYGLGHSGT